MAQPALTTLIAATAGATVFGWGIQTKPVEAAAITYDFAIDVNSGNYAGKYTGSFTYNDSIPLVGGENCDVSKPTLLCATPTIHGLSIVFNFLGKTYTQQDDLDYNNSNQYPKLFFEAASKQLIGLSFVVAPLQPNFGFFINVNQFQIGNYSDPSNSLHNPYEAGQKFDNAIAYVEPPEPTPTPSLTPTPTPTPAPTPPVPGPGPFPTPDPCTNGSCTAVPEPSEIAGSGVALGLLGLGSWWMRRKRVTPRPFDKA